LLVDKELIEQAKEKLDDRNAFLMSELLELDNFDEKNLKACCPYHGEKTASFIYNRKDRRFHCFGCNRTVDIVDVLVEKGNTFLDSVKWLFEKAGIEYQFGEQNVKTRSKYKYPPEESYDNDRTKVYEYLAKRGISKQVVDYLDIRSDVHGNIAFHTYDENDVLTVVNYRKSYKVDKNKCWFAVDENNIDKNTGKPIPYDAADILFNMNRVNPNKPLVITEGQIDCASVIEAGYTNAVSVLKGSGNLNWIETCFDWLEQFDEIIVASDNDKAGIKMRTEVMNRLGNWRCKYVDIPTTLKFQDTERIVPITDLNEVLQASGKEFLLSLINDAKDVPIKSVAKLSEITELNPHEMDGFETGIKELDDELMKIFMGGVTLITGAASAGKTTFLNQIALRSMDDGFKVFLFSRELLNGFSTSWLNNVAAGDRNMHKIRLDNGKDYYVVNEDAKVKIRKYYDDSFFVYKDEESNEEDALFASMEECVRKLGVRTLVIDNLMTVELNSIDGGDTNKQQTLFINRCIKFSMKYNVAIILVAHPRKLPSGAEVGLFDVAGSQNIVNLATRTISLRRVKDSESEDEKSKLYGYNVVISNVKDRIFGSTKEIPVRYQKSSRRFYTSYQELDRQYKWDENIYTDKIPYVEIRKDEFPDK
jgi:twinkle protein